MRIEPMIHMRARIIFAVLTIVLSATQLPAQNRKLYPVDEAAKDRSFKVFRDRLLAAANKKDKEFILSILDPKIELSFGGHVGVKDFKEMWKFDKADSPFWDTFAKTLKLGGAFKTSGGHKEFVAPYITSQWPEIAELDVFEYVAVIGTNVRLRETPSVNAPVVVSLSYDIVKLDTANPSRDKLRKDGFSWIKVVTDAGKRGYVADKYLRSPIDYRAHFRKVNGTWRMTAFIAGD